MTQKEIDKLLNHVCKEVFKKSIWKFSRGFLYSKINELFFVINITTKGRNNRLIIDLGYKHFSFDDVFWRIVDMDENINARISLRAFGAFTMPTSKVYHKTYNDVEWGQENLNHIISSEFSKLDQLAKDLASEIITLEQHLDLLNDKLKETLSKFPDAKTNMYKELLIHEIIKGDFGKALDIANERIEVNDHGGFSIKGKSFYEHAKQYLSFKTV